MLLVPEGFTTAKDLARILTALFTLSRELLSPQQHYDWGLSALKTSLGIVGRELSEVSEGSGGIGASVGGMEARPHLTCWYTPPLTPPFPSLTPPLRREGEH